MTVSAQTQRPRNDRETRLRKRIDFITDQKDEALAAMWEARDEIEKLERRVDNLHSAVYEARRSRDMWRERAKAAEEMVNRNGRRK